MVTREPKPLISSGEITFTDRIHDSESKMPSNTSESGLEALITNSLIADCGYVVGDPKEYDREHAVDLRHLADFLTATQDDAAEQLKIASDHSARQKFLHRLQGEIASRGVIDVLRNGVEHDNLKVSLYYGIPTPGNETATQQHASNVFSVTRQLRYSRDKTQLSLDMAIFINGLPVATFELKNSLTKQTYADAITQYKTDRDPRELLFQFGRCMVHFAVDDQQVWMCTHLKGKNSWFLPFNKGDNDGAGNPVNPNGLKTDYLWKQILAKPSLCNILESYAQVIEEEDEQKKKKKKQIFPRFHQLDCVRKLLADAGEHGVGRKYLIQHSAGSGKSNSITWLTHQLVDLTKDGDPLFGSVIVVTDRVVLDKQLRENIKQFAQVSAVVGVANKSGDLRKFIQQGKKIIITTVQKFPFVIDEIGNDHRDRTFALVIDEAHSSQGGKTMAAANIALSEQEQPEDESPEERIARIIKQRKMLSNASYFAFTATPKNKTLELFGEDFLVKSSDGDKTQFRPFHGYTMKQAIQEGFIQDVLKHYTPVDSWYKLVKTIEDDPSFDTKKAQRKLKLYVESHDHAIRKKAEIMIDHFHDQVAAKKKIGGQARAMVVTSGIQRAMQYKTAFDAYLEERKSPFKAIVAFSGDDHEYLGQKNVSEATMNGFPGAKIEKTFKKDPYRFLIVGGQVSDRIRRTASAHDVRR